VPVRATRKLESGVGPVNVGAICGVRQEARGYRADAVLIELKFESRDRSREFRTIASSSKASRRSISRGRRACTGDVATSAITLNTIEPLRGFASRPATRWLRFRS
jgi:hypothetical protein